jgi:hypothetical protein
VAAAKGVWAPKYDWLAGVINRIDIKLCPASTLGLAPRFLCSAGAMRTFLDRFGDCLPGEARLIWQTDETIQGSLHQELLPLVTDLTKLPQITGFVPIWAEATFMKPLIILLNPEKPKGLLGNVCNYDATSIGGWIPKKLWSHFATAETIVAIGTSWPDELRDQGDLVIVDGHGGHLSLTSAPVFRSFRICLIVRLEHPASASKHLTEPSPLRSRQHSNQGLASACAGS